MSPTRSTRLARAVIVAIAAVAWACALASAPILAAADARGPSAWSAALAYRAGAVICHQQDARSFHVSGMRMPVCARCAGLYIGGAIGALAALAWMSGAPHSRRVPLRLARGVAIGCALPTLAAWAGEHAGGLAVTSGVRAALALPLGAVIAAIVTGWAGGAVFDDTPPSHALD